LPAGITQVEGEFLASDAVRICDRDGKEMGRGLVNYSSGEIAQIKGHHSEEIAAILGYIDAETVIHRDNLVIGSLAG
jgi:glutamate 5-kinase